MNKGKGFVSFVLKNKFALIIAVVAVVCLLFLGDYLSSSSDKENNTLIYADDSAYTSEQERKLQGILSQIDGVGKCEVMIAVSGGYEYVYAQNVSENSYGSSTEYITIDNGQSDGLAAITVKLPRITGVAVVCGGGGSVAIKNEITEIICSMYGLSAADVYVSKHK